MSEKKKKRKKKKTYKKTCPVCGKIFTTTVHNKKYCSNKCGHALKMKEQKDRRRGKKKKKKTYRRTCPICGKAFIATNYDKKYCGKKCKYIRDRRLARKNPDGREPTLRMKKAAKNYVQNNGNLSKAMRDAGYSDSTVSNAYTIKKRKTWQKLMEEYLPEEMLATKHNQLINAKKYDTVDGESKKVDDNSIQLRATDMAYKLRGKYADENINITRRKYSDMSNEDLVALKEKLRKKIYKED